MEIRTVEIPYKHIPDLVMLDIEFDADENKLFKTVCFRDFPGSKKKGQDALMKCQR